MIQFNSIQHNGFLFYNKEKKTSKDQFCNQ